MLLSQTTWAEVDAVEPAPTPDLIRDEREVDARLDIPESRPFPDSFYEQVAEVYSALAMRHRNPNAMIADANELNDTKRVEQWVRKARGLGYLPPAHHGKRG